MLINLLNWTFPNRMERWWYWWRGAAAFLSGVTPQPAELILIPVGNYTFKLYPQVKSCSHLIHLNTTRRVRKSTCLARDKTLLLNGVTISHFTNICQFCRFESFPFSLRLARVTFVCACACVWVRVCACVCGSVRFPARWCLFQQVLLPPSSISLSAGPSRISSILTCRKEDQGPEKRNKYNAVIKWQFQGFKNL